MQQVEVVATGHFSDSRIGSVSRKQRLFVPINVAEDLHSIGLVEYPNAEATASKNPPIDKLVDGGGVLPVLLPAAQVLQPKTVMQFRALDGEQLQSTTLTDAQSLPMPSTPVISNGGESTLKKRGRPSKESAGLKTSKQPENTESNE